MARFRTFLPLLALAAGLALAGTVARHRFIPALQEAGVFFVESITAAEIRSAYDAAQKSRSPRVESATRKVRILIVPGHDREFWGTEYAGLEELDLNLRLGQYLALFLRDDPALEVTLAQTSAGYLPAIADYLASERQSILAFQEEHRARMRALVAEGAVATRAGVEHNFAPGDGAMKLYGISKWANENVIDIVLHLHFNDDPSRWHAGGAGRYSGFALYVPERQFSNARASRALGDALFAALATRIPPSDHPLEASGIVEDQELVAVGANNSLDAAVALIEYGYIYEPQVQHPATRPLALREAAYQTARGVLAFLKDGTEPRQESLVGYPPPRLIAENLTRGSRDAGAVFTLQLALAERGFYPPRGRTLRDCPLSGAYRSCTEAAVREFQKARGLTQTGAVGPKTRKLLEEAK